MLTCTQTCFVIEPSRVISQIESHANPNLANNLLISTFHLVGACPKVFYNSLSSSRTTRHYSAVNIS